jgi:hypothetical protein
MRVKLKLLRYVMIAGKSTTHNRKTLDEMMSYVKVIRAVRNCLSQQTPCLPKVYAVTDNNWVHGFSIHLTKNMRLPIFAKRYM